jgi:hypothetical protein
MPVAISLIALPLQGRLRTATASFSMRFALLILTGMAFTFTSAPETKARWYEARVRAEDDHDRGAGPQTSDRTPAVRA